MSTLSNSSQAIVLKHNIICGMIEDEFGFTETTEIANGWKSKWKDEDWLIHCVQHSETSSTGGVLDSETTARQLEQGF